MATTASARAGQHFAHLRKVLLQRRAARLHVLEHASDLAELGLHPGRCDDGAAAPVGHGGPGVDHARAVAHRQLVLGRRCGLLLHRQRLAGERSAFLRPEVHWPRPAGRRPAPGRPRTGGSGRRAPVRAGTSISSPSRMTVPVGAAICAVPPCFVQRGTPARTRAAPRIARSRRWRRPRPPRPTPPTGRPR